MDPNLVALAGDRAAQLIVEHCGGELVGVSEAIAQPIPKRRFLARLDRVRALLGVDVDRDAAIAALTRLGLEVEQSAGALDCLIPTWRPDLTIEDDIAEEVGRIALGYAHIPEKIAWQIGQRGQDSPRAAFIMRLKNALVAQGLQEVITHSLVADGGPGALLLRNPMAPEYSQLRTSLVPGHIAIAQRAVREGIRDIAIFEVASVYIGSPQVPSGCGGGGDLTEPLRVSGLVAGSGNPNLWAIKGESYPADFYFAKGIVESLLATLGITAEYVTDTSPFTHPYRTASVLVNGQNIGMVGECSTAVVEANDLPKRTCVFGEPLPPPARPSACAPAPKRTSATVCSTRSAGPKRAANGASAQTATPASARPKNFGCSNTRNASPVNNATCSPAPARHRSPISSGSPARAAAHAPAAAPSVRSRSARRPISSCSMCRRRSVG